MKNANYRKHNDRSHNSSTYHKKDGTPVRNKLKQEAEQEISQHIEESKNYLTLRFDKYEVAVKMDDEGLVIDLWDMEDCSSDESTLDSTWATYSELGFEVKRIEL